MTDSLSFERIAGVYDATRGGMVRGRRMAGDIAPWLAPGTTLEVGVGTGAVALGLAELGHRVVGVDIAPGMLATAYRRLGPAVAVADAAALPIASGAVANTVFVHVLHLVGDLPAVIAEAARVLRPGGRLVALHDVPDEQPDDELAQVTDSLRPLREWRTDSFASVRDAGTAAGLRLVSSHWSSPAVFDETPADLTDKFERRIYSWLWRIDEATWEREVEPVIAALRAMPDPQRPRRQVARTRITVMEPTPPEES